MKKFTKILSLLLALVMVTSVFAACGESGNEGGGEGGDVVAGEPQYGGHVNVRIASTLNGLDPLKNTGMWRYLYQTAIFEPAVTRDDENEPRPCVCDFTLSDDKLTFTLKVREGKTFSNGKAVTIEDVKASFQRAFDLYSNIKKRVVPNVESMEIEGDQLVIKFKKYSTWSYRYLISYQTWCAVMPKEICEKYNDKYILDEYQDAIGTGPYVISDYKGGVQITLTKRSDYTPMEQDKEYSGLATTKYGYLDSMTFWYNGSDSSAALALLNNEYDMCEVIPSEYHDMAKAQNIKCDILKSNATFMARFNTFGTNVCAKYPSLRKAIMAAIDYDEFAKIVTDEAATGVASYVTKTEFDNGKIKAADYYGPTNLELVNKYLEAARAEGYKDEPVQYAFANTTTTIATLVGDYLDKAGIKYQINSMEQTAFSAFTNDNGNNWDFYCNWIAVSVYPTDLDTAIINDHYKSEKKDALVEEMKNYPYDSKEYMDKWEELSQLFVDDCAIPIISRIDWFWWMPETLHTNDENSLQRYMFNAYWDDPANHVKK